MTARWYVAETEPYKGIVAEQSVKALGFEVFNPKIKTIRKWAKRKPTEGVKLYIPGYLFVRFDTEVDWWERINNQRGVRELMSIDEIPTRVSDAALLPLIGLCGSDGFVVEKEADELLFRIGSVAAPVAGPFQGHEGTVRLATVSRLRVMLTVFGRPTAVEGPPSMFRLVKS